jgi:hypothetical protein
MQIRSCFPSVYVEHRFASSWIRQVRGSKEFAAKGKQNNVNQQKSGKNDPANEKEARTYIEHCTLVLSVPLLRRYSVGHWIWGRRRGLQKLVIFIHLEAQQWPSKE